MPAAAKAPVREGVLVLAAILVYAGAALYGVSGKSATFDEHIHVAGGYSYWSQNDYRLNPEAGNLAQRWVALPLAIQRPNFLPPDHPAWTGSKQWVIADVFFYDLQ